MTVRFDSIFQEAGCTGSIHAVRLASGGELAHDAERPGVVRVQGVWIDEDRGVVITRDRLSFLSRDRERPISLAGAGEASVLHFSGLLGAATFGV